MGGRTTCRAPWLVFYGDDFTGSTDALEALTLAGIRTVLLLRPPYERLLRQTRFSNVQCFGIAGTTRSMHVDEMTTELHQVFRVLQQTGARVVHYKVCSTFDSSANIGSIGRAIDVGRTVFASQRAIPLMVGAPPLKRFTVFGHHFAGYAGDIYRLDRHPVMSRHPVTPMTEADLRVHLSRQTQSVIVSMNVLDLDGDDAVVRQRFEYLLGQGTDVVLFDVINAAHMRAIGGLIWSETERSPQFVVGSSGVEYALTSYWKSAGLLSECDGVVHPFGAAGPLLAVSGSCSPVTQRQIERALDQGFVGIRLDGKWLAAVPQGDAPVVERALATLNGGRSIVLYTALGPRDPEISRTREMLASRGIPAAHAGAQIGRRLGQLVRVLLERSNVRRLLIAGGDTAGSTVQALNLYGLEMLMPVAPGAPLCRVYADHPGFDGLQVVLKGGQIGDEDFFERVQNGECP